MSLLAGIFILVGIGVLLPSSATISSYAITSSTTTTTTKAPTMTSTTTTTIPPTIAYGNCKIGSTDPITSAITGSAALQLDPNKDGVLTKAEYLTLKSQGKLLDLNFDSCAGTVNDACPKKGITSGPVISSVDLAAKLKDQFVARVTFPAPASFSTEAATIRALGGVSICY